MMMLNTAESVISFVLESTKLILLYMFQVKEAIFVRNSY